jgi:hypothetical protein
MGKKEDQARWYQSNREQHIANVAVIRAKTVRRNQRFIIDYLLSHSCVDCGEMDVVVLQFDHTRGKKRKDVSRMMACSRRTLKTEIEKCDVRCANCHQRKTSERRKDYKWAASVNAAQRTLTPSSDGSSPSRPTKFIPER